LSGLNLALIPVEREGFSDPLYPFTAPPPSAQITHVQTEITIGNTGSSDNPTIADAHEWMDK
jgi:hypothetical protein